MTVNDVDRPTALQALGELKSIYQAIGGVAAQWRRCKHGSKRFRELEKTYDKLVAKGWELSEIISEALRASHPLN